MSHVMMSIDWSSVATDTPYSQEAFAFVQEGLAYTSAIFKGAESAYELDEFDRHVTGQQLCMGLRDYAIEKYGYLAHLVLKHWGIHKTDDFGTIVFAWLIVNCSEQVHKTVKTISEMYLTLKKHSTTMNSLAPLAQTYSMFK